MSEPTRQQIGDGSDNYGQAAGQMAKAVKQAGQETAKQAAAKGAEATANAAAATVKAGMEGGKAAAGIAAGTAMGGPWGAILSAVWSLRHTLFKILICICLALLLLITMIVSLPTIVTNSIFGLDGTQPADGATLSATYSELTGTVSDVVSSKSSRMADMIISFPWMPLSTMRRDLPDTMSVTYWQLIPLLCSSRTPVRMTWWQS